MNLEIAKTVVAEWLEAELAPNLVPRSLHIPDVRRLSNILAIVGPRRSGKTYFMYQLIQELIATGSCTREDILFIDFEDYHFVNFTPLDTDTLLTAFHHITGHGPAYIFFDEIQHAPEWSRIVRTLHNTRKYKIIVSGSNSELLSREIATQLRGRYQDVLMLPFGFDEYLRFREIPVSKTSMQTARRGRIIAAFDEHLATGGFPEVIKCVDIREKKRILQNYYRTIYYHDILERYHIKAPTVLEASMNYCLNIYGSLFSVSAFEKQLEKHGQTGSKRTIAKYLHFLQEAFFMIALEKFSYSPRKRIMNPKKIYLLDTGFSMLATNFSENKGKILENRVAVELYRREKQMYYHKGSYECDFIIMDGTKPYEAVQVCWQLDDTTSTRELRGLAEAVSAYSINRARILTYNQEMTITHAGITVAVEPVWKWLLNE